MFFQFEEKNYYYKKKHSANVFLISSANNDNQGITDTNIRIYTLSDDPWIWTQMIFMRYAFS